MQQNFNCQYPVYPQAQQIPCQGQGASAVNINIITPQAYAGNSASGVTCPINPNNQYSLYGANPPLTYPNNQYSLYGVNPSPNLPLYPQNYNNMMNNQYNVAPANYQTPYSAQQNHPQQIEIKNSKNADDLNKTQSSEEVSKTTETNVVNSSENEEKTEKKKTKKIIPLTDDYIKSLENYMNNSNPKIRLIGAKELLERFKEDENRKDNPSLMPLLNKALRDNSPAVRILALIALQSDYALGNDETVSILRDIQTKNTDKVGEDSLLASEILLKMAAPQKISVPMTQEEIAREQQKTEKKKGGTK